MADKKGPTKGSGGKHRNKLRGRGPTPRAEDRVYHKAYKARQAARRRQAADPRLAARRRADRFTSDSDDLVIGRNAVLEALRAGVPASQLYLAARMEHDDRTREIVRLAGQEGLNLLEADRLEMNRIARSGSHQGVALKVRPYRIEHQKNFLTNHPNYDAIGTLCTEFIESPSQPICLIQFPEKDTKIRKFAKLRNPCRHPSSVRFRKSAVLRTRNYQNYPYFEDYDLFVRMLTKGSRFYDIQEPLVSMRVGEDFYSRRGGWPYTKDMVDFKWRLHKLSFLSTSQALKGSSCTAGYALFPMACASGLTKSC
ncbi:RNA methyltransferase substrate-binding domain-containing protein [Bifidobacterium asteroides]|uniref:RNA methyltransferase substrate-binding domain-containing protein n=1 Tax=Bifidobacterium asteroides TaxID=1684 RepID=UPI0021ABD8F0|nr:RNA methyltransferase substrate-binding domain-containing protein [Bifidobacterium asteroides]